MFRRFIDDVFFVWTSTLVELQAFLSHMNNQHPYIKFTSTYNVETKNVPFLDLSITIKDGLFTTDLYKKETAICQYLLPSSCHVSHQWRNTIYSLALRLRRICSSEEAFEKRLLELKGDLLSRHYHLKFIVEAFDRARAVKRKDALKKVEAKPLDREVFAVTFHPNLPSVSRVLKKHWEVMVSQSNRLKRCFPKPPLVAYRRGKNLGDQLFRAKISTKRKSTRLKNGCAPCRQGCQLCWHIETATTHEDKRTGQVWGIHAPINCKTDNVIYKIMCQKCGIVIIPGYLGETKRTLGERIAEHRGYVRQKKLNQATGAHFNLPGHTLADLRVVGIERVLPKKNDTIRKIRETFWINQYESSTFGLNKKD